MENSFKSNIFTINTSKKYIVDFDKVKDFNDLKDIVQVLFVGLPITISKDFKYIDEIKEYLIKVE